MKLENILIYLSQENNKLNHLALLIFLPLGSLLFFASHTEGS